MDLKADFTCKTCNKILREPITVPCTCNNICKSHVDSLLASTQNQKTKVTSMTCQFCKKKIDIPKEGFVENKAVKSLIDKEIHLSDAEKAHKLELTRIVTQIHALLADFKVREAETVASQTEQFSALRKKIDSRRELLISQINKISEALLSEISADEDAYKKRLAENSASQIETDAQSVSQSLSELFRDPALTIDTLVGVRDDLELKTRELTRKLDTFTLINSDLHTIYFEAREEMPADWFGRLGPPKMTPHIDFDPENTAGLGNSKIEFEI